MILASENLEDFPFSAEQQRQEAVVRAAKISIQGVQPKLSVRLNRKHRQFDIVDFNSRFIVKPQHHIFPELPQNEDLTMRMAVEQIALPIRGQKNNLSIIDLVTYYGKEQLGLNERTIDSVLQVFSRSIPEWYRLVQISFLSDVMRDRYRGIIDERVHHLGL